MKLVCHYSWALAIMQKEFYSMFTKVNWFTVMIYFVSHCFNQSLHRNFFTFNLARARVYTLSAWRHFANRRSTIAKTNCEIHIADLSEVLHYFTLYISPIMRTFTLLFGIFPKGSNSKPNWQLLPQLSLCMRFSAVTPSLNMIDL